MKPSLQFRLSQHLTLTPQLQQSIRLLQLSTVELDHEIDRLLMENPALEREDGDDGARTAPKDEPAAKSEGEPVTRDSARDSAQDGAQDSDWSGDVASTWRGGEDE